MGELRFVVQPTAECDGDECLLDTPVPPELLAQAPSDGFVPWVRPCPLALSSPYSHE